MLENRGLPKKIDICQELCNDNCRRFIASCVSLDIALRLLLIQEKNVVVTVCCVTSLLIIPEFQVVA